MMRVFYFVLFCFLNKNRCGNETSESVLCVSPTLVVYKDLTVGHGIQTPETSTCFTTEILNPNF